MSVARHSLDRASRGIRISAPLALDKRRAMLGYDALAETEQQFQLPLAGTATANMSFGTADLEFSVDFFDAPEQRDSPLSEPQFTFGAFIDPTEQTDNPTGAVLVCACVSEWVRDTRGAITGAKVTIGTCVPGALGQFDFTGTVHLTFQGYGAPTENEAVLDVGT